MDVTVFSKFSQGEGEESRVPSFNTMEIGEEYEHQGMIRCENMNLLWRVAKIKHKRGRECFFLVNDKIYLTIVLESEQMNNSMYGRSICEYSIIVLIVKKFLILDFRDVESFF